MVCRARLKPCSLGFCPNAVVYFLSRTGRFDAHVLSSLSITGLAVLVAFYTGGIGSFAAIWLVVVPLEAALSASRRGVATAAIFALAAAGALLVLGAAGLLPQPVTTAQEHGALAALGIISAALYATGLALGAESQARAGHWLLNAEEDRYHLLARNMTDVIVRHGRNGSVLFVSPAAEQLFGLKGTELWAMDCSTVHVAIEPAFLAARSLTLRAWTATVHSSFVSGVAPVSIMRTVHMDRNAMQATRCIDGKQSQADREVVAVAPRYKRAKIAERTIEIAQADLNAPALRDPFLATAGHELRTPLNAIIGYSDMMTNDSLEIDTERRREYARLINESGRHLLSVVNSILDVSKMETGNFEITPELFAPVAAIESCTGLLALKAQEAGVALSIRLAQDLPEISADRRAFNQILINLISNSIKFTPRGGQVTVSALCHGPKFVLSVEDTGVGIGEADLGQLGKPFFQARASYDRRHDGSGLGLSIVKGLVGLHGGDVDIRSRVGEGTRVTVRLPIGPEEAPVVSNPVVLVTERTGLAVAANDR